MPICTKQPYYTGTKTDYQACNYYPNYIHNTYQPNNLPDPLLVQLLAKILAENLTTARNTFIPISVNYISTNSCCSAKDSPKNCEPRRVIPVTAINTLLVNRPDNSIPDKKNIQHKLKFISFCFNINIRIFL